MRRSISAKALIMSITVCCWRKNFGLNVPDAEIIKAGNVRALAVERFDRRWNAERTVLLRLPQEDMCQTFGLPSSVKYESDGGPGIARIMAMGSSEALKDRYDFMKSVSSSG